MTGDSYARLKEIVVEASGLPPDQRSTYLDTACAGDAELRAEAESLLLHDRDLPAMAVPGEMTSAGLLRMLAEVGGPAHPARVGRYRIIEVLGEGGMGVVYRAEQTEPIRREVALKRMRWAPGAEKVVARFETERQVLARLEHPNIATVLNAGADEDGCPYFVMELVQGLSITAYADHHHLSRRERIRLLLAVCRAVQHAHQKGIIHRDLKPSNLLVATRDGAAVPKVIDFGIAKALGDEDDERRDLTSDGMLLGSLRNMSPEQARGAWREVDVRSDVYALGVVLYELLTGASPYEPADPSALSWIRAVSEAPPRPFRETAPKTRIDSDLETITRTALAKDPERRYPSAAALADDLERFLERLPILARPPSLLYQTRKLVARHPLPAALAGGIVALILGSTVWLTVLEARERAALRRALAAERESGKVSDFLVGIFEISHPSEARGNSVTAREILDRGAARIETELDSGSTVQRRLMHTMGMVYRGLGIYDRGEELLNAALIRAQRHSKAETREEADILFDLARLHQAKGNLAEADSTAEAALAIRQKILPPGDPDLGASLSGLGTIRLKQARLPEAEQLLRRALVIARAHDDSSSLDLPAVMNSLGQVYHQEYRFAAAESLLLRSLALRERRLAPDHPAIADACNDLSALYWSMGRYDDADRLARREIGIYERTLGPEHPDLGGALLNQAESYRAAGRYAQAEEEIRRGLAILEKSLGPEALEVARGLNNLGMLYKETGRRKEARGLLERALAVKRAQLAAGHPAIATSADNLGEVLLECGEPAAAESLFREAIRIRSSTYGPDDVRTALPLHNLGRACLALGRLAEADTALCRALLLRRRGLGPAHVRVAESLEACADLRRRQGRAAAAETLIARADSVRAALGARDSAGGSTPAEVGPMRRP